MLLYHGSNVVVSEPRLIAQMRGLDFGPGFYLTTDETQARDFSGTVFRRVKSGTPTLNVYEFNETASEKLSVLRFGKPDLSWLEFVRDNRLKQYDGEQHDIIFGPVADDRVYLTLQGFVIGQFTPEVALEMLKAYVLKDQYCFATQAAIECLRFVKSEKVRRNKQDG
jgi:hypothetical protein